MTTPPLPPDPGSGAAPEPSPYGAPPPYQSPAPLGGQQPISPQPEPSQPYSQQPSPVQPYPVQPYGYAPGSYPQPNPPGNNLGVTSLILGILSLVACAAVTGIPAIIFGIQARRKVREGLANNDGMAIAGIIMGALSVVGTVLLIAYFVGIAALVFGAANAGSFSN